MTFKIGDQDAEYIHEFPISPVPCKKLISWKNFDLILSKRKYFIDVVLGQARNSKTGSTEAIYWLPSKP